MKYPQMLDKIKKLPFDKEVNVFSDKNFDVFVRRPSKLSKRFEGKYDVKKNFQIWLREKETGREFRPNHLRVMIDLNLRSRARPDLKKPLLIAFDNIFYGEDPLKEIKVLQNQDFQFYLNGLDIIAVLSQLFIIEQAYGYPKESKFDPPTLFYQGWVREMIDSPKEIDNLCMSVCSGQPPKTQYTTVDNKKHKNYAKKRTPLWYLQDGVSD